MSLSSHTCRINHPHRRQTEHVCSSSLMKTDHSFHLWERPAPATGSQAYFNCTIESTCQPFLFSLFSFSPQEHALNCSRFEINESCRYEVGNKRRPVFLTTQWRALRAEGWFRSPRLLGSRWPPMAAGPSSSSKTINKYSVGLAIKTPVIFVNVANMWHRIKQEVVGVVFP